MKTCYAFEFQVKIKLIFFRCRFRWRRYEFFANVTDVLDGNFEALFKYLTTKIVIVQIL